MFSANLKRLRLAKKMTQEQAAEYLGVSAQSVSRWECGNSCPDVMLLPEIARLYGVTIDDLYRENVAVYANYAQRLGAVYEATGKNEDFFRAVEEFDRLIAAGSCTNDDMRWYGILHQYMMQRCIKKAEKAFNEVISGRYPGDEAVVWRTKRQKQWFLTQIGRGQEAVETRLKAVEADSGNVREWELLVGVYLMTGKTEEALEAYHRAVEQFPEDAVLVGTGGEVYQKLGQYDSAFACWEKALKLDPSLYAFRYSMGFCFEEMGAFEKAYTIWCSIAEDLEKSGYESEPEFPRKLAESCRKKI